jgi:hypothetical protein
MTPLHRATRTTTLFCGLLISGIFSACSLKVYQPGPSCTPRTDLVSWWDGNSVNAGKAIDRVITHANNGTLNASTTTLADAISGVSLNAFNFNGSTSAISIPSSTSLNPSSAMSITAWVKSGAATNAGHSAQTIFSKQAYDATRFSQPANWQYLGTVADGVRLANYSNTDGAANALVWGTGTFDGRYLYFPSVYLNTLLTMVRYDTQGNYNSASSWKAIDLTAITGLAFATTSTLYFNPAFDGTYLYIHTQHGYLFRYNTNKAFDQSGSWDTLQIRNGATFSGFADANHFSGFSSTTFDGRYLYFSSFNDNPDVLTVGIILQYDTQGAGLAAASSWKRFDGSMVGTLNNANLIGYETSIFDGRYAYFFTRYSDGTPTYTGQVLRYDTQLPFNPTVASTSWTAIDLTTLFTVNNTNYKGTFGATFDGRYIYITFSNNVGTSSYMARYDTQGPFASLASWNGLDIQADITGDANYSNCDIMGYDGRFVTTLCNTAYLVQYDTQQNFSSPSSWTQYAALTSNTYTGFTTHYAMAPTNGSIGVSDGRYLYFPSAHSGYMARYDSMGGTGSYALLYSGLTTNGSSMSAVGPSFTLQTSGGSANVAANATVLSGTTWNHVAATFDGSSQINLYLNGSLAATQTVNGTLNTSNANATIGGISTTTGMDFSGELTQIGLYSSALSASTISAIYGGSIVPYCQ